jgi:hypothetical protein
LLYRVLATLLCFLTSQTTFFGKVHEKTKHNPLQGKTKPTNIIHCAEQISLPISTSRFRNQNKSDTPSTFQIQTKVTPIPTIRRRNDSGSRGARGAGEEEEVYQVLVDDVALEVLVPAVMEALLTNEVTNVDVAEAGSVGEEGACRRLTGPQRPRHQYVWARPSRAAAAAVPRRHRGRERDFGLAARTIYVSPLSRLGQ